MILSTMCGALLRRFGDPERAVDMLARAGYDAIDYSMDAIPDFTTAPDALTRAAEIRKYAAERGVFFNQTHPKFNFDWKNPRVLEDEMIPHNIRALEVSAALGAKTVVVHPFHHWDALPFEGHEEDFFHLNMGFYRALASTAKDLGVKICIENMWRTDKKRGYIKGSACASAAKLIRCLDTLDDDCFTVCLDLGHCALTAFEEPEEAIRLLGHDRLGALHVHDNDYKKDCHTLPFLGKMNFDAICHALADIDYAGDFTYEADSFLNGFPDDYLQQAIDFMEQTGRYLIGKIEKYRPERVQTV